MDNEMNKAGNTDKQGTVEDRSKDENFVCNGINDGIDMNDYPHIDIIETREELFVGSDYIGNIEQNYDINKRNDRTEISNSADQTSDSNKELETDTASDQKKQESDRTMDRLFHERERASAKRSHTASEGLRNYAEDARSNPLS